MKNYVKQNLKDKSLGFRIRIGLMILKMINPRFYELLYSAKLTNMKENWSLSSLPRPAIFIIKRFFPKGKKLVGVEIGVMRGKNAFNMLKQLPIEKLYLIDIWDNYQEGDQNYRNTENYHRVLSLFRNNPKIKVIKNYSNIAVSQFEDNSLDFCYIDGNHDYKYAKEDIALWSQKVKKGGLILGHDILNMEDVLRAVKDWCKETNHNFFISTPDFCIVN